MKIIRTDDFERAFKKLPEEIRALYKVREQRFTNDWRDLRLHVKKMRGLPNVFSFRITRRYRVFFYFQNAETSIFFDIDHRKDAYR